MTHRSGVSENIGVTEITAKIVLLGETAVGKSSLATRFVRDDFAPNQESTIGAAFLSHHVATAKGTVKFEIWDTAGQERYRSLAPMYYRGAVAALIVYDITSPESLKRSKSWVQELKKSSDNVIVALIGNKCDLEEKRSVPTADGQSLADEEGGIFFEASAKTGHNVEAVFKTVAERIVASGVATQSKAAEPPGARKGPGFRPGNATRDAKTEKSKCPC